MWCLRGVSRKGTSWQTTFNFPKESADKSANMPGDESFGLHVVIHATLLGRWIDASVVSCLSIEMEDHTYDRATGKVDMMW